MSISFKTAYPESRQWGAGGAGYEDGRSDAETNTTVVTCGVANVRVLEEGYEMPSIAMISEGVRAFRENEHDGHVDDVVTAVIEIWQAMSAAKDGDE